MKEKYLARVKLRLIQLNLRDEEFLKKPMSISLTAKDKSWLPHEHVFDTEPELKAVEEKSG